MKKVLLSTAMFVLMAMSVIAQGEQFVPTTVSNKNVILEEYTGINCGYCPDGHKIANQLATNNPGRVFPINIHVGSYAANTYTTTFGTALMNQTGLDGFPSGTVNRHVFSGSVTALGRGEWSSACNTIMAQTSPVNIAARGTLDWSTRVLSLTVQLYYTANEATSTNKLNVAIVQNNVLGSQSGSSLNPTQVVGSQYNHMHMFRGYITGQWGEEITTTTQGSFVEKTYTYTIPESLGSPNAITAKLQDLHFIAFVAQGNQEILTGCQAEIENINMPAIAGAIDQLSQVAINDCTNDAAVKATVSNCGSDAITSITFEYTIAGGAAQTWTWTGSIASLASQDIQLPNLPIATNTNQAITVKITEINNQAYTGTEKSVTIKKNIAAGTSTMTLKIKTDSYASETSYKLYGPNSNVVSSSSSFTNSSVNEFALTLSTEGCYRLEVKDSYGDGISNGYIRLFDANNNQVFNATGSSFTSVLNAMIAYGAVNIDDMENADNMVVFPNPATNVININSDNAIQQVELYNLQGQRVAAEIGDIHTLSVDGLANGMYILKVTTENGVKSYKVSKR